jgi:hypothetical protein
VTDIMGEISAATSEQAAGVSQVGEAISQMDKVTQQNAALVEEMAAAASSLKSQSQELVNTVAVFQVNDQAAPLAARNVVAPPQARVPHAPAARLGQPPAAKPRVVPVTHKLGPAVPAPAKPKAGDDGWQTF